MGQRSPVCTSACLSVGGGESLYVLSYSVRRSIDANLDPLVFSAVPVNCGSHIVVIVIIVIFIMTASFCNSITSLTSEAKLCL